VSPAGYWIAGAILLLGCGGAIVWFIVAIVGLVEAPNDFARFDVPGSAVVALDDGDWMIYHEYPGADSDSFRLPPSVDVTGPTGRPVSLRPVSSTYPYGTGDHDGVAIYEFTANDSGSYTIEADTVGEPIRTANGIAIGRPLFGAAQLGSILGSIGLGGVSLIAGLILLIVTIVRRGRARRARLAPLAPYGAPAYGQSPAYGQPVYGQPVYGQAPQSQAPQSQAPQGWPPPQQPQPNWPPPAAGQPPQPPAQPNWPPAAPPFTPPPESVAPEPAPPTPSAPPATPWAPPGSAGERPPEPGGAEPENEDDPPPPGPNPSPT
jgi:hypothetical protein